MFLFPYSLLPGKFRRASPVLQGIKQVTRSATIVLILLIVGDMIVDRVALPVPGAALGLAVLSSAFLIRGGPDRGSEELFDLIAPYFTLFLVPASVGVIASIDIISAGWVHILMAIVVSTAITLVITGLAFQFLMRRICRESQA